MSQCVVVRVKAVIIVARVPAVLDRGNCAATLDFDERRWPRSPTAIVIVDIDAHAPERVVGELSFCFANRLGARFKQATHRRVNLSTNLKDWLVALGTTERRRHTRC